MPCDNIHHYQLGGFPLRTARATTFQAFATLLPLLAKRFKPSVDSTSLLVYTEKDFFAFSSGNVIRGACFCLCGRNYLALHANPTHFLDQVFLESRLSSESLNALIGC